MSFADRMRLTPQKRIQIKSMDSKLRNRLFNFYASIGKNNYYEYDDIIMYTLDKIGEEISDSYTNASMLYKIFHDESSWYMPYEILEYSLEQIYNYDSDDIHGYYNDLTTKLNTILSEEKSGYRFVNQQFVPITDKTELEEIKNAMHSAFGSVNSHIKKSLALYSDREKPDYENSIKESISAVESMCCIITGMSGSNATLGAAIKKLEENGVIIHQAMKSAFSQLYGYTSDQDGIRHGGINFVNAPEEDARYMLVSCSAFVNYLKNKYSKFKIGGKA